MRSTSRSHRSDQINVQTTQIISTYRSHRSDQCTDHPDQINVRITEIRSMYISQIRSMYNRPHRSDQRTDHTYQINVKITQIRSTYRSHRSDQCTDRTDQINAQITQIKSMYRSHRSYQCADHTDQINVQMTQLRSTYRSSRFVSRICVIMYKFEVPRGRSTCRIWCVSSCFRSSDLQRVAVLSVRVGGADLPIQKGLLYFRLPLVISSKLQPQIRFTFRRAVGDVGSAAVYLIALNEQTSKLGVHVRVCRVCSCSR